MIICYFVVEIVSYKTASFACYIVADNNTDFFGGLWEQNPNFGLFLHLEYFLIDRSWCIWNCIINELLPSRLFWSEMYLPERSWWWFLALISVQMTTKTIAIILKRTKLRITVPKVLNKNVKRDFPICNCTSFNWIVLEALTWTEIDFKTKISLSR